MKKFYVSKIVIWVSVIILSGCTSLKNHGDVEQAYFDQQACNGELEISHTVVIASDAEQVKSPEVRTLCQPSVYETQTEFEKENRRQQ
ncbi:hypothetical protein [Thalassotalea sediminis]|uniref:hypothetical protein n=1 Tax=Thalassotalea sediminis TaxID=1759089 RepID=UPI002573C170|nr:hypothetical protein [Thalassotalea sediminis]